MITIVTFWQSKRYRKISQESAVCIQTHKDKLCISKILFFSDSIVCQFLHPGLFSSLPFYQTSNFWCCSPVQPFGLHQNLWSFAFARHRTSKQPPSWRNQSHFHSIWTIAQTELKPQCRARNMHMCTQVNHYQKEVGKYNHILISYLAIFKGYKISGPEMHTYKIAEKGIKFHCYIYDALGFFIWHILDLDLRASVMSPLNHTNHPLCTSNSLTEILA